MAFRKVRRALGACFGVGMQGGPKSEERQPAKGSQRRGAADGTIKAIHSTAAKDSGIQTEPLSKADQGVLAAPCVRSRGAQAAKGTAERSCQASDELATQLAADLAEAASRAEELAARLEHIEAARSQLEGALAAATTARQQLELELAAARQREEEAARADEPSASPADDSDDEPQQGGKRLVPALGHLDLMAEGQAELAAELAPELREEALARAREDWAAGDAVSGAQATAALVRAVAELDAAAAQHAGALQHTAVAPAFGERLGAGAYGTTYRGCHDGAPAVLKEYRVDANGTTTNGMWQRFTHNREVVALSVLERGGRPHTFVRPLLDAAARGTGLIIPLFPLGTLGHWLTTGPSVPALLHCCYTLAADLELVHTLGVAHLDIRPDNVGLRMSGESGEGGLPTAQLIDWGCAVAASIADCPAIALMVPANTRLHDAGWVAPELHATQRMHALRQELDGSLLRWTRWVGQPADVFAFGRCIEQVLAHPALAHAPEGGAAAGARATLARAAAVATRPVGERASARIVKRMLEGAWQRYQKRAARGE